VLLVRRRDSGNSELSGGRLELGRSATTAAEREVAEESSVTIKVIRLAGVYTDPARCPSMSRAWKQQIAAIWSRISVRSVTVGSCRPVLS
jgi:ADP-ribose pyrophosphatase YjhB (NUDIX family)